MGMKKLGHDEIYDNEMEEKEDLQELTRECERASNMEEEIKAW